MDDDLDVIDDAPVSDHWRDGVLRELLEIVTGQTAPQDQRVSLFQARNPAQRQVIALPQQALALLVQTRFFAAKQGRCELRRFPARLVRCEFHCPLLSEETRRRASISLRSPRGGSWELPEPRGPFRRPCRSVKESPLRVRRASLTMLD